MYKIKVLNRLSPDAIHTFDNEYFNEFISTLSGLVNAGRVVDVYQNSVLVATSDGTSLHQIKKIKKN